MLNKKLKAIADLIPNDSKVLDVGTDHAYLPIYLANTNKCKSIIASDISPLVIENAKKNIAKNNCSNIKLVLSDGLENIKDEFDALIIAGMGTDTIINIIKNRKLPNTIILSSNNHHEKLRRYMNNIEYSIKKEIAIKDGKKYYDIILYTKGYQKLNEKQIKYGLIDNKDYYKYLYEINKIVFDNMNFKNKIKSYKNLRKLKKLSI